MDDTHPRARAVQVRLLAEAGVQRRCSIMRSLTATVISSSRATLRRLHPDWSEEQILIQHVALCYGRDLAERFRRRLIAPRSPGTPSWSESR